MTIKRIVPNLVMKNKEEMRHFYREMLGADPLMDMGWIMTFQVDVNTKPQLSLVSAEKEGMPQPVVSIEVDDVNLIPTAHSIDSLLGFHIPPFSDSSWQRRFCYDSTSLRL